MFLTSHQQKTEIEVRLKDELEVRLPSLRFLTAFQTLQQLVENLKQQNAELEADLNAAQLKNTEASMKDEQAAQLLTFLSAAKSKVCSL